MSHVVRRGSVPIFGPMTHKTRSCTASSAQPRSIATSAAEQHGDSETRRPGKRLRFSSFTSLSIYSCTLIDANEGKAPPTETMIPLWVACALLLSFGIITYGYNARRRARYTQLRGPPRRSYIYGYADVLQKAYDQTSVFEEWSKEHGSVFRLPVPLGKSRVVVMDPKAINHIWNNDTYGFQQTPLGRLTISLLVCSPVVHLLCETDDRKRLGKGCYGQKATVTNGVSIYYISPVHILSRDILCIGNERL